MNVKKDTIYKILLLLGILAILSYISKQIKKDEEEINKYDNSNSINKYLLKHDEILKSSKPLLWIHIPRELNSKNGSNFGEPNSYNVNQPYIYLTVRSIIEKCGESFTVCLIDDDSFKKILPGWNINMDKIKSPILDNVRTMGILKIMYLYGGLTCPKSFLCQRDMMDVYNLSFKNKQLVAFERQNEGLYKLQSQYVIDTEFIATYPQNETIKLMSSYMEELISTDYTNETIIMDRCGMEFEKYVKEGKILKLDGVDIGIKKSDQTEVFVEDLMTSDYIQFSNSRYGIYIPGAKISKRRKYEWFTNINAHDIMISDTTLGKQILLTLGENHQNNQNNRNNASALNNDIDNDNANVPEIKNINIDQTNAIIENNVGYWETPLGAPVWGLKPNHLGNHVNQIK